MKRRLFTLLSVALLMLVWQLIAFRVDQPELFPSLWHLLLRLAELLTSGSFYLSVGATVIRGMIGIIISLVASLLLSVCFARWEWLYELCRPWLTMMRSVPVISFILLALIFLNSGSIPLLIAFLTMFPLLTENITKGLKQFRQELTEMGKLFRLSRRNRLMLLYYPQIKPFLFSGLSSAVGFGWRAIIMGEVLSQATWGIGGAMKRAQSFIEVPELIAWTIVAIAISYLSDKAISRLSLWNAPMSFSGKRRMLDAALYHPNEQGIRMEDVSYRYGIAHLSYHFQAGKIYAITAPSGAGKTTLLRLLSGIMAPTSGTILPEKGDVAVLSQETALLPTLTVRENILLPLASLLTKEAALQASDELLAFVELTPFASHYPQELSFGQQQRAAIARALIYPAPTLLMDEPFKGVDAAVTHRIIARIRQRQQALKQTIIFVSHQPEELQLLAEELLEGTRQNGFIGIPQ